MRLRARRFYNIRTRRRIIIIIISWDLPIMNILFGWKSCSFGKMASCQSIFPSNRRRTYLRFNGQVKITLLYTFIFWTQMPSCSLSDLNASLCVGEWNGDGFIIRLKFDVSFLKRHKDGEKSKNSNGIATKKWLLNLKETAFGRRLKGLFLISVKRLLVITY